MIPGIQSHLGFISHAYVLLGLVAPSPPCGSLAPVWLPRPLCSLPCPPPRILTGYTAYYVARQWINAYAKDRVATLFDWYGEPYHIVLTLKMAKKFNFVGGPGPWKKQGKRPMPHDEREADEEKGDHGTLEAVNDTITNGGWEVLQRVILRKPIADHGGGAKSKKKCIIS